MSVTLAKSWDPDKHNVLGWMYSEKLDGVRATFNGYSFTTRNGNTLHAPEWFIKSMPSVEVNHILDGELYLGRGKFNECSGIARSHNGDWSRMQYHVFDIIGTGLPFRERFQNMCEMLHPGPSPLRIVQQRQVDSVEEILRVTDYIVSLGGEGLMLKNPYCQYEPKRTSNLLKVKKFYDAEYRCIGIENGKGKYSGLIGSLVMSIDGGFKTFNVGSGLLDEQRAALPHEFIGKMITVKYFELSKDGIPRFPIYKGIRTDI